MTYIYFVMVSEELFLGKKSQPVNNCHPYSHFWMMASALMN